MQPYSSASVAQLGKRAEVAVHAEDAVGDEQRSLRAGQRRDDLSRGIDVTVRKDLDRRATQACAIDDARVVQFVRDDHIVATEE